MELIERAEFLATLQNKFQTVVEGEGHCIFLSGMTGMGKTSLVNVFCKEIKYSCNIYRGSCDALFTPRPLAPLYDIAGQLRNDFWHNSESMADRAGLFSRFFYELANQKATSLIVFEDIHWADEATLDFIKFFARRITQLQCLFILTYRDDEIHLHHPLRNVLGQMPVDSFTRLELTPLSKEAVKKLASEKGYDGEYVYRMAGGNPFYVNEILASYHIGVPDSIKDAILSTYNYSGETTKRVWDFLSVIPDGFEIKYLEKYEPLYVPAIENSVQSKILFIKDGLISFKHELFRRTVEATLSPFKRIAINKRILDLFRESFEQKGEIERIIHHAKNANEYDAVVHYAPLAAKQAASVGAHIEASRLYLSAIEYYQGSDADILLQFYEAYAYECYLTNQIKEAITYTGKSLNLWKKKNDTEMIGNCMRFLSQLWFFEGKLKQAESFASQAIEVLDSQPFSRAKAMAYSNMSQLKIRADQPEECIFWGEKAIAMAKELADEEILSYALNNVGFMQIRIHSSTQKGIELLQQSLTIALKNSHHENAARAYANLGHNELIIKEFELAKNTLETGIQYCEERDLDSWTTYMLSSKARLFLETGRWDEACRIADSLLKNEDQIPLVKIQALAIAASIKMRCGDIEAFPLLHEAKTKAFEAMEMQRVIPVVVALLEYEWITGMSLIEKPELADILSRAEQVGNAYENSELAFWLLKTRKQQWRPQVMLDGYNITSAKMAAKAAAAWGKAGCYYQQALTLFEGTDDNKRKAILIIQSLAADAVYQKMKLEMRASGIKRIPRGVIKTTQSNSALLTRRELDVLQLLKDGLHNKEIATKLFISAKTVDHHISAILFKLDVNSRVKAVKEALRLEIIV
ncbi:MAG TPA: AAA family ATPase [Chitinophagaceae bacterium]|jgi:DNA-binding CsgD family transcriptional regulator|nr:AAA family ATPase [Chitinophagaceae bacterium]